MKTLVQLALHAAIPALFLATPVARASLRTLTDTQGRTIQAQVLGVEDNKAKIRREDGQIFELALDRLVEEDRKALLDEMSLEIPPEQSPSAPKHLNVQMSRAKFASETVESDVRLTNGDIVKNGRSVTEEKWGYNLMLNNRGSAPLTDLRAEYILFATKDSVRKEGRKEGLRQARHRAKLDDIPAYGKMDFRTEAVSAYNMKYKGNIVSSSTGDRKTRESLHGMWIKIYSGDELVYEAAFPDRLAREEKW